MIQENCFFAYPGDTILKWSIKDFGPFYLPSRGDTIVMDDKHYLLYRNLIEWEQQDKLIASNGSFLFKWAGSGALCFYAQLLFHGW